MEWSNYANENFMGKAHTNPIQDNRLCQVEFSWGEVTELITNLIAELVYVLCDADGNKYLLLD